MKLFYYDWPGYAEMTRLALHAGGVAFEDERFPEAAWPTVRKTVPNGRVPLLTLDDGTVISEYVAVLRHAGRIGTPALYPADARAAALVDEATSVACRMAKDVEVIYKTPVEQQVAAGKAALAADAELGMELAWLNASAAKAASGHVVGDGLTIVDCIVKTVLWWLTETCGEGAFASVLAPYPALAKTIAVTSAVPAIAAYQATPTAVRAMQIASQTKRV